jgi:hypothetical protein
MALLTSERNNDPGARPYDAAKCLAFNKSKVPALQAYCHPIVSTGQIWLWAAGWSLAAIGIGIVYFWRAEARYGRG